MLKAAKICGCSLCSVIAIAAQGCATSSSTDPATSQSAVGGGELASPLLIGELSPTAQSTPTELVLTLNDDVDQLSVQTYVKGPGEMPLSTSCQTRRIYRVGPDAVDWSMGQTLSLPLAYPETLPAGLYEESVRIAANIYPYDYPGGASFSRAFEVSAGVLEPISSTEYSRRVDTGMTTAGTPDTPMWMEPCPPQTRLTDEVDAARATSVVKLAQWSEFASIQPWRSSLRSVPTSDPASDRPVLLSYRTIDASGTVLHFEAAVAPDALATGVTLEVPSTAHFWMIEEPRTRAAHWNAAAGTVTIAPMSEGLLSVAFTDLILDNEFDPSVQQNLGSGAIVGRLQTKREAEEK